MIRDRPRYSRGCASGCRSLLRSYFLQQRRHVGPEFLARFLLIGRQLGDGGSVADAGEVGVFLPVLEHLADAGVFLDVGLLLLFPQPCFEHVLGAPPIWSDAVVLQNFVGHLLHLLVAKHQ